MIYLDNAATTRPSSGAVERAACFLGENFYNPSATYGGGVSAARELAKFRAGLLEHIADPAKFKLVFTSGGTEADNTALFGGARRGNIVVTAGEHAAVERSAAALKSRGVEIRVAPIDQGGGVEEEAFLALVDANTSLACVMHVNNETGAVNDVFSLSREVKRKNPRTLFFSDGVQAFGKIPFTLPESIDLYAVSAHKIGGPKGTGALIKRRSLDLPPLLFGGGQEENARSGTENVFGAAAFYFAAEETFADLQGDRRRVSSYRDLLWEKLSKELFLKISPEEGSPFILTVSAEGLRGEVLQRMLWDRSLAVGTGSACSSKHRFSRVIAACGYRESVLDGVLRISFSRETKEEEVLRAAEILNATAAEFKGKI